MFIVVRGVVKLIVEAEGKIMPYYMGSGECGCLLQGGYKLECGSNTQTEQA